MEEILKAITWPHVAFLIAVIFLFIFKKPLSNLIARITSIDKEGVKAGPSPKTQREKTETTNEAVQQLLDKVGNSIVINEQEEIIKKELEEKGLLNETDGEKILIKHLAGTQLLLAFEKIYNLIFGSQITLLKKLNGYREGIRDDLVNKYIEQTMELDRMGGGVGILIDTCYF